MKFLREADLSVFTVGAMHRGQPQDDFSGPQASRLSPVPSGTPKTCATTFSAMTTSFQSWSQCHQRILEHCSEDDTWLRLYSSKGTPLALALQIICKRLRYIFLTPPNPTNYYYVQRNSWNSLSSWKHRIVIKKLKDHIEIGLIWTPLCPAPHDNWLSRKLSGIVAYRYQCLF